MPKQRQEIHKRLANRSDKELMVGAVIRGLFATAVLFVLTMGSIEERNSAYVSRLFIAGLIFIATMFGFSLLERKLARKRIQGDES